MGYRSDVYIKVTEAGYNKLLELNNESSTKPLNTSCVHIMKSSLTANYLITYSDVKWYEYCDCVTEVNDMLNSLANHRLAYSYIIVGEDGRTTTDSYTDHTSPSYYSLPKNEQMIYDFREEIKIIDDEDEYYTDIPNP